LNALAGPFLSATPSLLSARWFPENERTKSTACGTVCGNLGASLGFFIGPYCLQLFSMYVLFYFEVSF
jgi:MFS family permease